MKFKSRRKLFVFYFVNNKKEVKPSILQLFSILPDDVVSEITANLPSATQNLQQYFLFRPL